MKLSLADARRMAVGGQLLPARRGTSILDVVRHIGPLASREIDLADAPVRSWESAGWTNDRNLTRLLELLPKDKREFGFFVLRTCGRESELTSRKLAGAEEVSYSRRVAPVWGDSLGN
jgi:uncharacterized protein YcaQ